MQLGENRGSETPAQKYDTIKGLPSSPLAREELDETRNEDPFGMYGPMVNFME